MMTPEETYSLAVKDHASVCERIRATRDEIELLYVKAMANRVEIPAKLLGRLRSIATGEYRPNERGHAPVEFADVNSVKGI